MVARKNALRKDSQGKTRKNVETRVRSASWRTADFFPGDESKLDLTAVKMFETGKCGPYNASGMKKLLIRAFRILAEREENLISNSNALDNVLDMKADTEILLSKEKSENSALREQLEIRGEQLTRTECELNVEKLAAAKIDAKVLELEREISNLHAMLLATYDQLDPIRVADTFIQLGELSRAGKEVPAALQNFYHASRKVSELSFDKASV